MVNDPARTGTSGSPGVSQPVITTDAVNAWTASKREAGRLDRLRAQANAALEAMTGLHQLLVEDIEARREASAARSAALETEARANLATLTTHIESLRLAYNALAEGLDGVSDEYATQRIDRASFERKQRSSEEALRRRAAELAAFDQLRARFVAVLAGRIDEDLPPPPDFGIAAAEAAAAQATATEASTIVRAPAPVMPAEPTAAPEAPVIEPLVPVQDLPAAFHGSETLTLERVEGNVTTVVAGRSVQVKAHDARAATPGSVELVELRATGERRAHPIAEHVQIGRAMENDLCVLDSAASRRHAHITATDGTYVLEDLKSQNGTFVNGARVQCHPLADGDHIVIGETEFLVRFGAAKS